MKIYVASSWRNKHQPGVVARLREEGHDVYDFRDPEGEGRDTGFHWFDIDPGWKDWTPQEFIAALNHDLAVVHFHKDFTAMKEADVIVMVLPCGKSAHFETGWGTAAKRTAIYIPEPSTPELMYKQADYISESLDGIVDWLAFVDASPNHRRPEWDEYFMRIAKGVATRATCNRKRVGAAIVDPRHRIVSTGYNGAPAGMPHCDDVGHELKEIEGRMSCVRTLHAESNALDDAGRRAHSSTLYVTVTPCYPCAQRLVNAGITRIVYGEWYDSQNTDLVAEFLKNAGVEFANAC